MSKKELEQVGIFEQLAKKEITQVMASHKLKLTSRQIRRKLKRFLKWGAEGLVHKSRGCASPNAWRGSDRNMVDLKYFILTLVVCLVSILTITIEKS